MLTQDAVIEIVRNYARDIEAHGVHLRTVILYGSFAKGTQHGFCESYTFAPKLLQKAAMFGPNLLHNTDVIAVRTRLKTF